MGNLIGTNPRKWVKTQVDLRQQLLGLENRDPEVLTWANNNTAWMRVASSVNIVGGTYANGKKFTAAEKSKALTGQENFTGRELAKKFILFGGTGNLNNDDQFQFTQGIYPGGNNLNIFDYSYGFGGVSEQGLVSPPGVESIDIKTYNRGSFRKVSLKIKANSKKQFDIIEALYMHPGFTLLVEWGHTMYYAQRNESDVTTREFKQAQFNTSAFNTFFSEGKNQDNILQAIDRHRIETRGNYDGFFGKIVNFRWSFEKDASYSITVDAISLGDVIESLTINRIVKVENPFPPDPKPTYTSNPDPPDPVAQQGELWRSKGAKIKEIVTGADFSQIAGGSDIVNSAGVATPAWASIVQAVENVPGIKAALTTAKIAITSQGISIIPPSTTVSYTEEPSLETTLIANQQNSQFHKFLYDVYNELKKNEKNGERLPTYKLSKESNIKVPTVKVFGTSYQKTDGKPDFPKELLVIQPKWQSSKTTTTARGSVTKTYYATSKNSPLQYMKFGAILDYIQENLLVYAKSSNGKGIPYVSFDKDYQNTYCFTYPTHFSSDPNICLIPFKVCDYKRDEEKGNPRLGNLIEEEQFECFYEILGNDFRNTQSEYAGRLMDIHVNLHFIVDCLESAMGNDGIVLLRFLESLLNGIQGALGNINKLNVTFDHDTNTIKFIDDIPLDPKIIQLQDPENFAPERKTLFNVYGWRPGSSQEFNPNAYLDVSQNSLGYGNVQNGTFVYDVSLDSGLTPAFATMLAIGAQSRGTSDISNATAFNKFHAGLEDRIIPDKISKAALNQVVSAEDPKEALTEDELKALEDPNTDQARLVELRAKRDEIYGKLSNPLELFEENLITLRALNGLIEKFYQRGIMVDSTVLQISNNINSNVSRYLVSLLNDEGGIPSASGFIPFDLKLTMLGISGIRMYERFYIDQNILPTSYNSNLSFIIKGVDHKIGKNGWETEINSLAVANNATTQTNEGLSLPKTQIDATTSPTGADVGETD